MCAPAVLLVAALSGASSVARAHAPLSRGVVLGREPSSDGAMAIRLPGFGLVARANADAPFRVACDALIGLLPTDEQAPIVALPDGTWLVGTEKGLRRLAANGCPQSAGPTGIVGAPIVKLAVAPSDPSVAYAVTGDPAPALFRSADGGQSWKKGAELKSGRPISALLVSDDDPNAVYVSATTGAMQSEILVSRDGGGLFETHAQTRDLTLLDVREGPQRLIAHAHDTVTVRGVQVYRATSVDGEWQSILALDFFGGFARAGDGTLFVGDEAGSIFRSSDGGDSFDDVHPEAATACLVSAGQTLWACTPGLTTTRAVATLSADQPADALQDVVALADVDQLVECGAELDVAAICANAWVEWSLDVRGVVPELPDAGTQAVDAAMTVADSGDEEDAATRDEGAKPRPASPAKGGDGCSVERAGARTDQTLAIGWACGALLLTTLLRRVRTRRKHGPRPLSAHQQVFFAPIRLGTPLSSAKAG